MTLAPVLAILIASAIGGSTMAHEKAAHAAKAEKKAIPTEEKVFGRAGNPKQVSRPVKIDMSDAMRFTPAELTIRQGETIRFELKNSGRTMHEMVLGTMKDLKEHAELMRKHHPGMEHDEPYMAHVAPGKTGRIVWQFTQPGEFHYGCLIPGHFEAGMVGKINVIAR